MTFLKFGFAALSICLSCSVLAADDAEWIWSQHERQPGTSAEFQKSFSVGLPVTSAVLRGATSSTGLDVSLNGSRLMEVESYDPLFQVDVTDRLKIGEQNLTVRAVSVPGPAAFFLRMDLTFADGTSQSVVTDTTWLSGDLANPKPAVIFGKVDSRLLISPEWQIGVSAFDNYEQWRQAKAGNAPAFLVSPGFEVQLVRSAQPDEDSWVSLAFDPRGNAIIAKEKVGLLRLTLTSDGAGVTGVETINTTLQECRGLLFAGDDLYADANNSKGLYRLPGDQSGQLGQPVLVHESAGGVGHGRNDLALGPDGRIHVIHGDSVNLPTDAIDYTSTFREARQGKQTSEGHWLRIDPKGGKVHLLGGGLRNPFGIDFNADGECFTYDADAEHDMGAPWYRPTRVVHLVTGADFGWRGVTGAWPPYYPDHPDDGIPNLDIGKGSPTAVKFGTRSNFPDKFRKALFILDWAYGRIIAVHMLPRGGSYLMAGETFLKGRPLNVTDLDFRQDGSMYFVTGGRGTQSGLYRVRYVGKPPAAESVIPQEVDGQLFARQSRERRRRLESLLTDDIDPRTLDDVWNQLGDDDPWIRHAARNVLERQSLDRWQAKTLTESRRTIALNALMSLARANKSEPRGRILNRLNELDWEAGSSIERLVAAYTYQLCLSPDMDLPKPLLKSVESKLLGVFPDRSVAVNQILSAVIARFDSSDGLAKTIELLRTSIQQAESMHYLYVLRNSKTGWTIPQRGIWFEALANAQNYQGGAGMPDFLKKIREEAVATLTDSERKSLGKLIEGAPDETIAEPAPVRPFVRKWTMEELSDSLADFGSRRDVLRGKEMFNAAGCVKCHRVRGHGRLIGPDLTSAPSRFSRRDILESIVSPSKVIPESYRSVQIVTTDGMTYVGRVALGGDYRSETLHLATDPLNPYKTIAIPKKQIEIQQPSTISLMPDGTLNTLTKDEIFDLLAFIEGQGG